MHIVTTCQALRKEKLNHTQTVGVKHYEDFTKRIPRDEVDKLKELTFQSLANLSKKLHSEVCGSYRRGASSSGDMDVLVTHEDFDSSLKGSAKSKFHGMLGKIKDQLVADGIVTDVLSCGETKFMGVCRLPDEPDAIYRRIDIRFWPKDQYPLALLYFTGSDELNKEMRRVGELHSMIEMTKP